MAVLIPLPYLYGTLGILYLVLVVPATLAMLYASYISFTDPTTGQSVLKYGTFLTAAAFIIGRLATIL